MGYIDMHCDTLMLGMIQKKDSIQELEDIQIDLRKRGTRPKRMLDII